MKYTFILVLFLSAFALRGQSLEITYMKQAKVDMTNIEGTEMSAVLLEKYKEHQIAKSKTKKFYLLKYNNGKSEYSFLKIENPRPKMSMNNMTTYKDISKGLIYSSGVALKPTEAIRRNMKNDFQWETLNEKKEISGFQCSKAIIRKNNGKNIIAWYTTEIPIADGPSIYAGLPGLIIQLETNSSTTTVVSVEYADTTVEIPEFKEFTDFETYRKSVLGKQQNK